MIRYKVYIMSSTQELSNNFQCTEKSQDLKEIRPNKSRQKMQIEHYPPTEGCMGEHPSLEFDLTFGDVLLHKLVQAH